MSIYKQFYDIYGEYKVFLVNEYQLRSLNKSLQEFSNYAISSDFPQFIPKNEIWLSFLAPQHEHFILINEALHRIKYEKSGMSAKDAYQKALKFDKVLRHKLLHSSSIKAPTHNKLLPEIYIKKYDTINNINIWIVNGELIRNYLKTDFVEGTNDYVDYWVPHNEILIDNEVPDSERIFIIIHEFIERELIRYKKLPYNVAHTKASKIEWRSRKLLY